jgi:hypothetical protein
VGIVLSKKVAKKLMQSFATAVQKISTSGQKEGKKCFCLIDD